MNTERQKMSRITQYGPDVGYYIPIDIGMETDMNRTTREEVLTDQNEGVSKLAEYEDAEESGLLIRLPCKIGETVYVAYPNWHTDGRWLGWKRGYESVISSIVKEEPFEYRHLYGLGKTVFTTREEAEKALHHD